MVRTIFYFDARNLKKQFCSLLRIVHLFDLMAIYVTCYSFYWVAAEFRSCYTEPIYLIWHCLPPTFKTTRKLRTIEYIAKKAEDRQLILLVKPMLYSRSVSLIHFCICKIKRKFSNIYLVKSSLRWFIAERFRGLRTILIPHWLC